MTVVSCDRCGRDINLRPKIGDPTNGYIVETQVGTRMDDEREIIVEADLCAKCHDALVLWLKSSPLP